MSTTITSNEKQFEESEKMAFIGEKETKLDVPDDASFISGTTTINVGDFAHAKTLIVNAKGVGGLMRPMFSPELVIHIVNPDGTLAYESTRERKSSGNCVLTDAQGHQLISSTYLFGPGRDPTLTRLGNLAHKDSTIKTKTRWTSRTQQFILPDGRTFEWQYKREKGFGVEDKKHYGMVLTMNGRRLAILIRNSETRTPGSKWCYAGNGGELRLSEEVGSKEAIDEELVVATVLMQLKREMDRN